MKRQLIVACTLALLVSAAPAFAFDGDIGIYADTGLAQCQATLDCTSGPVELFVFALLRGASSSGITGAEFGIKESNPGGMLIIEDWSLGGADVVLGNAWAAGAAPRGINLAWADCQGAGIQLIGKMTVLSTGVQCGESNKLIVEKHDNFSNQFFQCPLFTLCDSPAFTKVCMGFNTTACANPNPPFALDSTCSTSGEFVFNPGPGEDCVVAVEETTWSEVKSLYSN